ncbi:histidine kinase N-terminal 7TM domain-containing protein [Negadavirga shengliensis]|uniref:histidine kinase n=1 Tax=Negadavirga shengliensis TaxID=1389218 RepID=A0ABV9T363_9BACT
MAALIFAKVEKINFHIVNFVFLVIGFVPLFLSLYAKSIKGGRVNKYFSWLMMACFIYSLGNALEMFAASLNWKIAFLKMEYLGAVFLGPLMLMLAIHYTGNEKLVNRKSVSMIFLVSFSLLGLVLTNPFHRLFYREFAVEFNGLIDHLVSRKGMLYWVHQTYTVLLLVISLWLLIRMAQEVPHSVRRQVYMVLFGLCCPFIIYLWYLTGTIPYQLDVIPFGFALAGIFIFLGLLKFKLFQIAPVAYKTLFDNMEDGVIVTDLEHNLITCNLSAKRFMAFGSAEMTLGNIREEWPEVAELIISPLDFDVREFHKIQQEYLHWFLASKSVIKDNKDNVVGNIISLRDITQEKNYRLEIEKAREAAEKANQAKSEFLANMSHEIRTPLNGVIGFTELLTNTQLNEQQKRYANTALQSAGALLDLINDILDLAKIEAGKTEMDYKKTNLYDLLQTVVEVLCFQAHQKGLELLLDIEEEVPEWVVVDRQKLKQILINLLNNALKFTQKGEVILKVSRSEVEKGKEILLKFAIKDTGIGIEQEKQTLIFDAFSQADSSTTKKYGGTGLGLTISTRLLSMMGSKIRLDSCVGKGSTFYFDLLLPFFEEGTPKMDFFPSLSKVLLIDNNESSRDIIQRYCRRLSVTAISTGDFGEAFGWMETADGKFQAVIMDHKVLGSGSIIAVEKITNLFKNKYEQPHFVAMVGADDGEVTIEQYKRAGYGLFLNKPVTLQKLIALFKSLSNEKDHFDRKGGAIQDVHQQGISVLLVEDNSINRMLIKVYMERLFPGVEVIDADSGRKALELYESRGPDLVLTDLSIQDMNGYEICNLIRNLPGGKDIPIIGLSVNALNTEKKRGYRGDFNDFMTKPIFHETFKAVMERWLPKKHNGHIG